MNWLRFCMPNHSPGIVLVTSYVRQTVPLGYVCRRMWFGLYTVVTVKFHKFWARFIHLLFTSWGFTVSPYPQDPVRKPMQLGDSNSENKFTLRVVIGYEPEWVSCFCTTCTIMMLLFWSFPMISSSKVLRPSVPSYKAKRPPTETKCPEAEQP